MKGYNTKNGYMGYVPELGYYLLFSCEQDYMEFMEG